MSEIILPRRLKQQSQPTQLFELAPAYKRSAIVFYPLVESYTRDIAVGNNLSSGSMSPPTQAVRNHGRTWNFNGTTTRLQSANVIAPTSPFTVFCWTRPSALNTGYMRLIETDYASGFYLGSNTGSQYSFIVNNGSLEGCIGGQQVTGQRDFLAGVFDGTNRLLYVNGLLVGSDAATTPTTTTNIMCIGGYPFANFNAVWNGDIDGVGVFARAMSGPEILSIYHSPKRLFKSLPTRLLYVVGTGQTLSPAEANSTSAGVVPTLTPGAINLSPAAGNSTSAGATPTLTPGAVAVAPAAANSTSAGVTPTLSGSGVASPAPANSTSAGVTPTLVAGAVALTPSPATSTSAGVDPSLTNGSALQPNPAASSSAGVTPTLTAGAVLLSLAPPVSTSAGVAPTLTAGAVTISSSVSTSTSSGVEPSLSNGIILTPSAANSQSSGVTPTLVAGTATIAPPATVSLSLGVSPVLVPGPITLTLVVANSQSSGVAPVVTGGSPNIGLHPRYYGIGEQDRSYTVAAEDRKYTV